MRKFLPALAIAAFGLALLPQALGSRAALQDEEHTDETPLETQMLIVKKEIRSLKRSLRDPEKAADSLASIAALQAAALASKAETPRMLERIPEENRAAFVTGFRLEILKMLEQTIALERAVLQGDAEATEASYDALRALEDPAHEQFTDGE